VIESAEELLKRVEEGWKIYYDRSSRRWRMYLGSRKELVAKELDELARKIYVEQRARSSPEAVEGGQPAKEYQPRSGVGAGTSEPLRALGEEYAAIIKTVTEKTRWFAEALVEVGWVSTLMAFQYARIEPKDIPLKIAEFTDPKEFVRFVTTNLTTMVEAGFNAAQAIAERDKMITRLNNVAKFLAYLAAEWRNKALRFAKELQIAHILIEKYGLINEYLTLYSYYTLIENTLSTPPQKPKPSEEVKEGETPKNQANH